MAFLAAGTGEPDLRLLARSWCDQLLPGDRVDFWGEAWRLVLRPVAERSVSMVLTGAAGSGKSVLAACLVREMLADPPSLPVVLSRDDVLGGLPALSRRLGIDADQDLTSFLAAGRELNRRILFLVDGLDSIVDVASAETVRELLRELANSSCLLVTCRTEFWDRRFLDLSFERRQVPALEPAFVKRILRESVQGVPYSPVLLTPIFFDITLEQPQHSIVLPKSETGLLQVLWNSYRRPAGADMRGRNLEHLLVIVAEQQFTVMSYEVSRADLVTALDATGVGAADLAVLEAAGKLRSRLTGLSATVRLGHDLLDCFNMARLLVDGDGAASRRQLVYQRAAVGVGWPVLAMLAQIAHDRGDHGVLRELFTELLRILDRKRLGDDWMARSWAATYVIRDKIAILMPFILECLDGAAVASVRHEAAVGGSSLGPDPKVSQEVASSLASVFDSLQDWRAGLPERAIPALSRGLGRWRLRKRFVEALAVYQHPDALRALTVFARKLVDEGDDPGLLGEVAEALGRLGDALAGEARQMCIELLGEVVVQPNLESRVRRAVIVSKNKLTYPIVESVPDVEEDEIIANLNPIDEREHSYSDWRVVEKYAEYAYERIVSGHLTQPLLAALLRSFTHDTVFIRIPIARCLGRSEDPLARAALIAELLRPSLSWHVQQACLEALDTQVSAARQSGERALRAWLVLHASEQATESSLPAAAPLAKLAAKVHDFCDGIITPTAIEIVSPADDGQGPTIDLAVSGGGIPAWIAELAAAEDYAAVGDGWERKYRAISISRSAGRLSASLMETTWEEGASFHHAMSRRPDRLRENADRILGAWFQDAVAFPGILSVHCVVVTGDRKVVATRRPAGTVYSAGCWSVSFEEQVTDADWQAAGRDPVSAAALRGFAEEFALATDFCTIRIVSAIVEFPIVNPVFVAVITTQERSETLAGHIAGCRSSEVDDIRFLEESPDALRAETQRPDLHPTSALRMLILARLLAREAHEPGKGRRIAG